MSNVETVGALPDVASADVRIGAPVERVIAPSMRAAVMLQHPTLAVALIGDGVVIDSNPAWRRLFAIADDGAVEAPVATLFANANGNQHFDREIHSRLITSLVSGPSAMVHHTLARRDGTSFSAEVVVWPVSGDSGSEHPPAANAVWHVRDLTTERELHRDLRELGDFYRELSLHQWDMTLVVDRKGRLSYVSPSVGTTLGYDVATLLGEPFRALLDPAQAQSAGQWLRAASSRGIADGLDAETDAYRLKVFDRSGATRVLACRPRNCFDVPGIAGMVVHARDVTETVDGRAGASESGPPDAASCDIDRMTGLPDRIAARVWLDDRIAEMQGDASLTMIVLDIDRTEDINQRYGHDVGDSLIMQTAGLLVELIGDGGYVARIDGDAFGIVLTNAAPKAVEDTVLLLRDRIGDMAASQAGLPHVDASIGAARLPGDADDAEKLWLCAELAMQEAKSRGRGQALLFNQRLAAEKRVRRDLDVEIADALARNEFVLFYQPQIALSTGRIIGLEALLRWQHPTRGLVLPNVFMDAAVGCGLTDAMTKSVLGMVCEQIAAWRRAGDFPEIPVAVNVVGSQFHDRRLPAQVAASLLRSGLPARLLVLELTEQTLIDDDSETQRVVKELDRLGVRTSVGGFALGHGALKQLRQLHVAQIKLDRGFVQDLPTDDASGVVVGAMIDVARRLKCQVVAEGVETREQFERLRLLGCEAGQGFFFGAPLSAEEIRAFVELIEKNPIR